ncbi:hypothetical protein H6758_00445 [Candidatus Nomurabacteria bacterium]|nr:hypothetical protein [Candidatus Nomurabacteria bacterium]
MSSKIIRQNLSLIVSNMQVDKLYLKQISLTEWYRNIGHKDAESIDQEDFTKRDRLAVLREVIGLPYDKPYKFCASCIAGRVPKFLDYFNTHKSDLCALRLIPKVAGLEKLRMRGKTVEGALEWFDSLDIDPSNYRAEIVPHSDLPLFGTIFVVTENGIFGEIIRGGHHQLTQGFYQNQKPIVFSYNFSDWSMSHEDQEVLEHLKYIVSLLKVTSPEKQQYLSDQLSSTFSHDYLKGYFETTSSVEYPLFFIDYNRILDSTFAEFSFQINKTASRFSGSCASPGVAQGRIRIVSIEEIHTIDFREGEVLACTMTSPDYLPLMQKASAIVTAQGGILSHAAIVSRELAIPCIVGVHELDKLKDGSHIHVNATNGEISLLN